MSSAKESQKRTPSLALKNIIYVATVFYTLILLVVVLASYVCIKKIDQKVYFWIQFDNIDRQILEVRRYEKTYLLYHNKEDLLYAMDYLDKLETELQTSEALIRKLKGRQGLNDLKGLIHQYARLLETLINKDQIDQETATRIRKKGHQITVLFSKIRKDVIENLNSDIKFYSSIPIVIFLLVIVFVPIAAYTFARWIIDPIEYLASRTKEVSEGDRQTIPGYRHFFLRYKEYDQLIDAINEMLAALNAKQRELLQAEKMAAIGTVISGIAHEINNPLNNIFLTIEVILDSFEELSKEELIEMLQDIYNEGERAREIVAHLLEFARSKQDIRFEPVDLGRLIEASYKLIHNQLRTKGLVGFVELSKAPVFIKGNFHQLQQVLVNIMVNAIQAMEEGGELRIRAGVEDSQAVIEISDTGPGIPEEIREKIFDPFFTTKEQGTGLGLSVSYSIVKKHRGDIQVESIPGQGTTFRIILPVWKEGS